MKLTADRDGNVRHFSAKLGWKEHFDPKEIEILSSGAVPMLIPPVTVQGRRNNVIQYDISAYSTLEFYLSCILSREQFAELLLQSIEVFQRMQQIYLNYKNLVFDLDKIYIQLSDRTIHFIYLPLVGSKREYSQADFFRLLVTRVVRSTYEQSSFLDSCLAWLNRPSSFLLSEFERFVRDNTCASVAVTPPPGPVNVVQGNTGHLNKPVGGTVLLSESEPEKPAVRYFIVRTQTDETIELNHFPFLIGTELGSVAYCVSGNTAVSRRHAAFSLQDGECVIVDQESTNKTYVNDCVIAPFTAQLLKDGDNIRLGNEKFRFVREELS